MANEIEWAEYIEAVAADILGAPNEAKSNPPEDVRFGNQGAVSVNYISGIWYDHEHECGGGVRNMIRVFREIEERDEQLSYAEECRQNFENRPRPMGNGSAGPCPYQRE